MTALLTARGLTVNASIGGATVPVLRGLDLTLARGQVLALVGESGAGKSMIGRTIAGDLPPGFAIAAGSLTFDGQDLTGPRARRLLGREIAFIPQEPMTALNPVRTIGAQFNEHLALLGLPDREARIVAALEAVHLPDAADLPRRYPHQLSGGMCQRVLIAMAFASRPLLVIADEPVTALDVTIQARIVELMAESRARDGTAMLFITHDLRLAAKIADEICVLYAGAVVEHGPATRVFSQSKHPYTRCLCLASPAMTGPRQALFALPDQMPGLAAMGALPGCRFAPRCAVAAPECRAADPKLAGIGHRAACPRTALTAGIAAPEEPAPARPRAGPAVLTIDGLGKRFRTGGLFRRRTVAAVSGVSFRVDAGEFVAVVGESGSGKTTLGRLIMGLERPDSGRMVLDGKDVSGRGAPVWRHRIGAAHMVFQDPRSALNPRRQVAEIVTQALEAAGVGAAERATRAAALLEEMGLAPELAARTPSRLSGGQRQRANIARALCVVPKLLVADEIVSGLDVSTQAQLLTLLQRLRRDHAFAMLFISHDLAVVRHLCDRVLVMYRGAIVEQGPVEAVFAAPAHAYTRQLLAAAV